MNPTTSPAARAADRSPLRRKALGVLLSGTVLAGSAALGPGWLARTGVVLAVLTGVVACRYAWREVAHGRRQHAADMLAASQRHGRALAEERAHNASVVDVLATRATAARAEVDRSHHVLAGMRVEVRTLRTEVVRLRADNQTLRNDNDGLRRDNAALLAQVTERDGTIETLRDTVRAREAELGLMLTPDDLSSLTPVPAVADGAWAAHPAPAEEPSWGTAVILPNYEHLTA